MSAIVFDCLVPPADADDLARAFAARLGQLESEGKISNSDVIVSDAPADEQLLEQWERENPDVPLGDREMRRYTLDIAGLQGSLNSLTMDLSRLLTPAAQLPDDPVLREFDDMLEEVARYPWSVAVRP
ncbi:hypothetical protein ACFORJ_05485 [Corynebacterium hansenii]|uniref:Uncharacterized protein n=1 Tax=Corynebacterium hansenii TaxID=394964 RepID=A0ABV7ZM24_9CORY|nr:hypothetical protein [Corynebacterium hansenii]WJZ00194.1 hypothetical protein CHAN_07925 [Corynebacterium hansenii]